MTLIALSIPVLLIAASLIAAAILARQERAMPATVTLAARIGDYHGSYPPYRGAQVELERRYALVDRLSQT